MGSKTSIALGNQTGAALVIALIMIITITLIALAASYTSIYEIKISGNARAVTEAFYAAECGQSAVISDPKDNFNPLPGKYIDDTRNVPGWQRSNYKPFDQSNTAPNPCGIKKGNATSTKLSDNYTYVPRGGGYSAGNAVYYLYKVTVTGNGCADYGNATVEQEVLQIVPKQQ